MHISAALAAAGGLIAWLLIKNEVGGGADSYPRARLDRRYFCAVDGAPLATARDARRRGAPRGPETVDAEREGMGHRGW